MNEWVILAIVGGFLLLNIGFYLFVIIFASYCVYVQTLSRQDENQWSREPVFTEDWARQMDEEGQRWHKEHKDKKKDVHIVNEGLNLYGEYYDFGYDRAVIILSGRTESLRYGYYFAKPYAEAGMNVLVVDPRAHGYSDGKYNTLGFEESKDDLAWSRMLHDEFHVKSILYHGICIGAAGGMFAITSQDCPDYVDGIVTEGMFANFGESMKNHLIERKKLWFPIMQAIDFWAKHYTGHSMMCGPIDVIDKLEKPILMLQSKMDPYSTPENAQKLYDKCPSKEKQLVYYETGGHSQLRITHTEKYDSAISEFIKRIYSTPQAVVE